MTVSRREAVEMLGQADRVGRAVESRAPKEHLAFIGWALFNIVVIPGFDVFDRAVWGLATMAIAAACFVATFTYYMRRSMQVEVNQRSPWWMWPTMGLWGALAGLLAWGLDDRLAFSYALAGFVAAAPLLAWGLHLRKTV